MRPIKYERIYYDKIEYYTPTQELVRAAQNMATLVHPQKTLVFYTSRDAENGSFSNQQVTNPCFRVTIYPDSQ